MGVTETIKKYGEAAKNLVKSAYDVYSDLNAREIDTKQLNVDLTSLSSAASDLTAIAAGDSTLAKFVSAQVGLVANVSGFIKAVKEYTNATEAEEKTKKMTEVISASGELGTSL